MTRVKPFKLDLKAVEPIHKDKHMGFVDLKDGTGGIGEIDHSTYPEEHVTAGKALRDYRIECKLTLSQGARRLGITVGEMSGLEHGCYTADLEEARKRLSDEIQLGDIVYARWQTKTGRTRSITGLVVALTEKRVQIRYSQTSSSGNSFNWAIQEGWRSREQVKKVTPPADNKDPSDALGEFVHALVGK